jgi:hypothetical protein
MATIRSAILGVLLAAIAFAASANTYHVTVWNGLADCSTATPCLFDADVADVPVPAESPLATFDFTSTDPSGDLGWAAAQGMFNTYGDFLDNGTISGFSSALGLSTFLSQAMSVEGNAFASYFVISGIYTSASAFDRVIMHDDGASLYIDGTNVFSAPARVTGQVTAGPYAFDQGTHAFSLYYIAADGGPAVLNFGLPNAVTGVVPEPGTLALAALALIVVGVMQRRRRSR